MSDSIGGGRDIPYQRGSERKTEQEKELDAKTAELRDANIVSRNKDGSVVVNTPFGQIKGRRLAAVHIGNDRFQHSIVHGDLTKPRMCSWETDGEGNVIPGSESLG